MFQSIVSKSSSKSSPSSLPSSFVNGSRDGTKGTVTMNDDEFDDDTNNNHNNNIEKYTDASNDNNDNDPLSKSSSSFSMKQGLVVEDEQPTSTTAVVGLMATAATTTTSIQQQQQEEPKSTTTTTRVTTHPELDMTTTNAIISKMTIRDKIKVLTGASFWTTADIGPYTTAATTIRTSLQQVPSTTSSSSFSFSNRGQPQSSFVQQVTMYDGPHGIRKPLVERSLQKSYIATCFPAECAVACSWNEDLVERLGRAVATEAVFRQVHLVLGPGVNLKRHPYNGRNFEYYSEDPIISGRLASAMIRGIQYTGNVGACCKHFAVNNQESNRFIINAIVDTRTLRELYFRSFEIIVKNGTTNLNSNTNNKNEQQQDEVRSKTQQPAAIMGSYNKVNGIYVAESYDFITNIIRNEWKYDGILISDWGATDNRIASITAGLDIEMPGSYNTHTETIVQYVKNHPDFESNVIDPCIRRIIQFIQHYTDPTKSTTLLASASPSSTNMVGNSTTTTQHNNTNNSADSKKNHSLVNSTKKRHNRVMSDLPLLLFETATDDVLYDQHRVDEEEGTILVATSITKTTTTTAAGQPTAGAVATSSTAAAQAPNDSIMVTDRTEIDLLECNYRIAYEVALECCVLLKNNNNCLPLALPLLSTDDDTFTDSTIVNKNMQLPKLAVIGDFGKTHPRFQGMGSSQINPYKVSTVYEALLALYQKASTVPLTTPPVDDHNNCSSGDLTANAAAATNHNCRPRAHEKLLFAPGYDLDDDHEEDIQDVFLQEALNVADQADIVLLCVGLPEIMESEGVDRTTHNIPAQHTALITEIGKQRQRRSRTNTNSQTNQKFIVILYNGSSIDVSSWEEYPDAILEGYLLGSAGGEALVDLLYGKAVPCGKLAESFPRSVATSLQVDRYFPGTRDRVEHREGLNIGYRQPIVTAPDGSKLSSFVYPFGHGLSYTAFEYSNLQTSIVLDTQDNIVVNITFQVTNTGTVYIAKEIIQCYIHDVASTVYRPEQELKDFIKISLQPLETQTVQLTLTKDAFAYYDIGYEKWTVEEGQFEIRIASSSTDIRLCETIYLKADHTTASTIAVDAYPQSSPVPQLEATASKTNTGYKLHSDNNPSHQGRSETTINTTVSTTLVTTGGGTNWFPEVDDLTFAKRFGSNYENVLQEIRQAKSIDPNIHYYGKVHRNTLIKEIAHRKVLGYLFYTFASRAVIMDLDRTSHSYKRQRYMMLRNFDNIPLRSLVLFSRGAFSYQLLDTIIYLLNATIWDVTKTIFQSIKSLFSTSINTSRP